MYCTNGCTYDHLLIWNRRPVSITTTGSHFRRTAAARDRARVFNRLPAGQLRHIEQRAEFDLLILHHLPRRHAGDLRRDHRLRIHGCRTPRRPVGGGTHRSRRHPRRLESQVVQRHRRRRPPGLGRANLMAALKRLTNMHTECCLRNAASAKGLVTHFREAKEGR